MWNMLVLVDFITITTVITMVTGNIFTSSLKVERLVQEEEMVLDELKRYIDLQYDRLKTFSNFYTTRLQEIRMKDELSDFTKLEHPNAVYKAIKRFSSDYAHVLGENFDSFRNTIATSKVRFDASAGDIRGASISLLRLQSVYRMSASDMAEGNYLGYHGPALTLSDTFYIAQTAFSESMHEATLDWLNVTVSLLSDGMMQNRDSLTVGRVKALMGRSHLYAGNTVAAESLFTEAKRLDPSAGDTLELEKDLKFSQPKEPVDEPGYFQNFSRLCSLENKIYVPVRLDQRS
ncbi:prolyl 4-hydroxylase subunit alpha-1 [Plakobranchus ocellatus]|uniref:Prolyl 4-hydroxylase subunit alpha-1 n=1 Tax=Plakobranchus ocellatus TaxID=259542 RepID=A0AAV4A1W7_9GAST|nr:prolyl 4-hydroxylase subunit alpha-1 [Plakobranchus ocellatus]